MTATFSEGDLVGHRWRLTGFLGQGGFGMVFSAVDESALGLGTAAVKVLHANTAPMERAEFINEVKNNAQLRHENLVAYLDSGEYVDTNGMPAAYLVTELCDESLEQYLNRAPNRRLAPDEARGLLIDLSAGLSYLHRRSVLHRDLKPANVLRSRDEWKLADFGLARNLSATGHYHRDGVLTGTPLYMAPEILSSDKTSAAVDVYAVGVILHRVLAGREVHEASADLAMLNKIANEAPTIDQNLPPEWRNLITRMVARDPAARPQAGELLNLLDQGAAAARSAGASPPHPVPVPPLPAAAIPPTFTADAHQPHHIQQTHLTSGGGTGRPAAQQWAPPTPGPRPVAQAAASASRPGPAMLGAAFTVAGLLTLAVVGFVLVPRLTGTGSASESVDGGGQTETEEPATEEPVTEEPSDEPSNELAEPADQTAETPEEIVARAILGPADGPLEFEYDIPENPETEFCVGVDSVPEVFPGVAFAAARFTRPGELFLVRAYAHNSEETAHQAIAYAGRLQTTCDGQDFDRETEGAVWVITPLDVTIDSADEITASTVAVTGAAVNTELSSIYARVGAVTIFATGSDRATVRYHAELMISRLRGTEPPERVEPTAGISTTFGTSAAENVRAAAIGISDDFHETVPPWVDARTDAELDAVFDRTCSDVRDASNQIELGSAIVSQYETMDPAIRGDLHEDGFFQLTGLGLLLYCPDEADRLGLNG